LDDVDLPITDDDCGTDTSSWARVESISVPEGYDRSQGSNLKWNNESLVEEEVPASEETKGIVNPVASQANESTSDRHVCIHLGDGVIDKGEDNGVEAVGDEETAWATLGETSTDGDEEGCSDGATGGDELDLTVVESSVEMTHAIIDAILNTGSVACNGAAFGG
jgi:hypothetical protein